MSSMLNEEEYEILLSTFAKVLSATNGENVSKLTDIMAKLRLQSINSKAIEVVGEHSFDTFNEDNLMPVRDALSSILPNINKDVLWKVGKTNYSSSKATFVLEAYINESSVCGDPNALYKSKYLAELPRFKHLKFNEETFLKKFVNLGKEFEFIGFIPTARKYKYLGRDVVTGEVYKFGKSITELLVG